MGLPIFREPDPAQDKCALKSNTAPEAQSRSAIRRPPPTRRTRLSSQHAHATSHEAGRPPVPPPMFFSFLRSNPGVQDIYERSSHRERAEMVEQFMRSRRVRASDLRQQQLPTGSAPAVNRNTRQPDNSRYSGRPGEPDFENATANDPIPTLSTTPRPATQPNFRPRSRRGHGPSSSDPRAPPYHQTTSTEEALSRRGASDTRASESLTRSEWNPAHTHGHWETLLTTIAPDPSLPSADSSFTSAAASFRNERDRPTAGPGDPGRSWQDGYVRLRSPNAAFPSVLIPPPLSVSPRPERPAGEQIPLPNDNVCESESEINVDTDTESEPAGDVGFVTIMERMIRTGRDSREINSELRDTSWDSISNSSVVSNARRELEILARGGDVPDSFWESAGLMTVLEYERRMADVHRGRTARG